MESPQISRSGRVLKKSAKVKEMEDFDINELDVQGKSRKRAKTMEDFDEYDDKRVAPIKIPKISLNIQGGSKKRSEASSVGKQAFKSFQSINTREELNLSIYQGISDASKETDSSSVSSESSSTPSSSDMSDVDDPYSNEYRNSRKALHSGIHSLSVHQDKVIVEQHQRYESPVYMEQSSGVSSDDSEDAGSDTALVIAEDSDESTPYMAKGQKGNVKRKGGKKDPTYAPRQGGGRRKLPAKNEMLVAQKKKPAPKTKQPLSAYMLWCSENRKKIAATSGNIGFGNIGKKMGEAWQSLPEKEKMAWRRKAKRLAMISTGNIINTGPSNNAQSKVIHRTAASINEELLKGLTESTGILATAPIDAAAHLKLLGDSLTVIGQRLIEHEGQLAVSGIYSVLLDTLLCALGPLLCLTTEVAGLEHLQTDVFKKTLDHIAYFMPGL